MSELEIVREILGSLPIGRTDILLIHSAFRRFSHAGLRAERFCDALLRFMDGGTVLMPTMTWRTVTPNNPTFYELHTPSHTGVLTEVFRKDFASHRSLHPTHSVAGAGAQAGALLGEHHLGTTPCPINSPYGIARRHKCWVLMLGVGLESCTAIHHAEEIVAPDLYVRPLQEEEEYRSVDRSGCVHLIRTRRHVPLARDFPKFERILEKDDCVAKGIVEQTRWSLFSLDELYRVVFRSLQINRNATLKDIE